jgi:cytochrome c553
VNIRRLVATAAVLFAIGPASAQKHWNAPQIVTSNCSGCHGIDGNAELSYFPRVAGLHANYAEKKMTAFQEAAAPAVDEVFFWTFASSAAKKDARTISPATRANMIGVSHGVPAEKLKEAVLWYAQQTPQPGHVTNRALIEKGKDLFMNGVPAQRVLACKTCHGPEAQGMTVAPRLAGQNFEYSVGQLEKFRRGDRRHAPEMTLETRDLDADQARAAAAYLQSR